MVFCGEKRTKNYYANIAVGGTQTLRGAARERLKKKKTEEKKSRRETKNVCFNVLAWHVCEPPPTVCVCKFWFINDREEKKKMKILFDFAVGQLYSNFLCDFFFLLFSPLSEIWTIFTSIKTPMIMCAWLFVSVRNPIKSVLGGTHWKIGKGQ